MGDKFSFIHKYKKNFYFSFAYISRIFPQKNKKIIKNLNSGLGDGDFVFLFIKRY